MLNQIAALGIQVPKPFGIPELSVSDAISSGNCICHSAYGLSIVRWSCKNSVRWYCYIKGYDKNFNSKMTLPQCSPQRRCCGHLDQAKSAELTLYQKVGIAMPTCPSDHQGTSTRLPQGPDWNDDIGTWLSFETLCRQQRFCCPANETDAGRMCLLRRCTTYLESAAKIN